MNIAHIPAHEHRGDGEVPISSAFFATEKVVRSAVRSMRIGSQDMLARHFKLWSRRTSNTRWHK